MGKKLKTTKQKELKRGRDEHKESRRRRARATPTSERMNERGVSMVVPGRKNDCMGRNLFSVSSTIIVFEIFLSLISFSCIVSL